MAKPRIFVSSTYYDLKHIRNSLDEFITNFGYESILFESGDIPFHHDEPLDISCYEEIKNAHILVLIIGGRYGSSTSDTPDETDKKLQYYNSITKKEYESAKDRDIPIYIFIEKNVLAEFYTYKKNRNNKDIIYAHVDNMNIFKLIEEIYSEKRNNLVKDFENFDDISSWLRDQWAGIFSDFLAKKSDKSKLSDLSAQIKDLSNVSSILREYSEMIMQKIKPENYENIINQKHELLFEKRLNRFIEEPMIEYLLKNSSPGIGEKKLYNAFIESENLKDFLEKAKFENSFITDLLETKAEVANHDYSKLKEEFEII